MKLCLLAESFICFELPAFFSNSLKRLTKSPKIYFYDTGLLCHLLKIKSIDDLHKSPHKGQIFENFVISETAKKYFNSGELCDLYYYRDDSKREVDLVDASSSVLQIAEIKSTSTFNSKLMKHLQSIGDLLHVEKANRHLIMNTKNRYTNNCMAVDNVRSWLDAVNVD